MNDSFSSYVKLLHLHGIEAKNILSFGVSCYASTSTAIRFFKDLVIRNKILAALSNEAGAWLIKLMALGVSLFYSTTYLRPEKLRALPCFWRILSLTDYAASSLIGTMVLVRLSDQVDGTKICPGVPFWTLCKSLVSITYGSPKIFLGLKPRNLFSSILLIALFHLGVLIEHSKKRIKLSRAKEGTYASQLLIRIRPISMFPMTLASWLMRLQMRIFERIYLVSIPLGERDEALDYVSDAETIAGFFLYTVQALYFLILCSAWSFRTLELSSQLDGGQAFLTSIEPGRPTKEYLGKVCSKLVLLEICYVLVVCLTSKLLYLEYDGALVFDECALLTYSRMLVGMINSLRSIVNLANAKSLEKYILFRI